MRGEQAGAGFRSLPHTSQWKAPLSPAASAGVSKGLSASRKPHPRESCASDITAGPRTGPAAALGQASEGDGGGVGSGYQDLGHVQEAEEAAETKVRPPRSRNTSATYTH